MVIRRLIEAAHDRLGAALDKLTADADADARFEDHAADPFNRTGLRGRLNNRPMPWQDHDAIQQDAEAKRREDDL
jgi:hypothetical protein